MRLGPTVELDIHSFLLAAMFILVGLQSVSFAIIGRRFASQYGFIPRSATFDGVLEALTLERVLVAAIILVAIGMGALLWGLSQWADRGFGALNPSTTMRAMILAMTTLVAGLQLAMSAFMSSMITIPLQERRIAAPSTEGPTGRRHGDVP